MFSYTFRLSSLFRAVPRGGGQSPLGVMAEESRRPGKG